MSDPKRATLITVGSSKNVRNSGTNTVRLNINLEESNESKYPELNYKELVIAQEHKKKVVNGKPEGLDPFSDNDDDVERVAKKFEQKYGGKSTYGRKGKSKQDEFADIGAGYDENDSFIDNTDGYDEMIPPECDTLYGGFYINSGSLEFKSVPEKQNSHSDSVSENVHRNKRRISSSSSESSTSSSSENDAGEEKVVHNGDISTHDNEHRKKKSKKSDKKAKRIRRNDSSAATSGKQTSDDNGHESHDSRTSHSDSLHSKPAPSSDNPGTSDSSREAADSKLELNLPPPIKHLIDDIKNTIAKVQLSNAHPTTHDFATAAESHLIRFEKTISTLDSNVQKCGWLRVARLLGTSRTKLVQKVKALALVKESNAVQNSQPPVATAVPTTNVPTPAEPAQGQKRKKAAADLDRLDVDNLTAAQREEKVVETLSRLKALIEERKPQMLATYQMECNRIQEERRKHVLAGPEAPPYVERRMPRRRFPWCPRARNLLARLSVLAQDNAASEQDNARRGEVMLTTRALPLFPKGFVRLPTLLRQADLKINEHKRTKVDSNPQPPVQQPAAVTTPVQTFTEPIQFPSSLTVTAMPKPADKNENQIRENKNKPPEKPKQTVNDKKPANTEKQKPVQNDRNFGHITTNNAVTKPNSNHTIKPEKKEIKNKTITNEIDDKYAPPTSIGSITITPVSNSIQKPDKTVKVSSAVPVFDKSKESLIRVKSPAALMKEADDLVNKKEVKKDKPKRVNSPLHIETNFKHKEQVNKVQISPITRKDDVNNKQIESLRAQEDKIPRPGLIPVHLSPTFAKPDKKLEKKKDVVILNETDPLSDAQNETLAVDDSSSDVEVIEDVNVSIKSDNNRVNSVGNSVEVPSKATVRDGTVHSKDIAKVAREKVVQSKKCDRLGAEESDHDIDAVMRNLRDLQDSQDQNSNTNSFSGAKSEPTSLNKTDGCSNVSG